MFENFVGQGIFRVSSVTKVGSGRYESSGGWVVDVFDGANGSRGDVGSIRISLLMFDHAQEALNWRRC